MKFSDKVIGNLLLAGTWFVFGAFWYFLLKDLRMNGIIIGKATEWFGYPIFGWAGAYLGTWWKQRHINKNSNKR